MREIKFRAWVMNDYDGHGLVDYMEDDAGTFNDPFEAHKNGEIVLMQYTGLKDKNGVEIYEGDLVRGRFIEKDVPDVMWLTLSEQEKEQGFRLFTIETIFEPYQTPMPDDIEVIGNIYENPELLEAGE